MIRTGLEHLRHSFFLPERLNQMFLPHAGEAVDRRNETTAPKFKKGCDFVTNKQEYN